MIKVLKRYLVWWILFSVVAAVVFGMLTPGLFKQIDFLGEIFLNLLKSFALPLVFSSLIVSLGDMGKNLNALKMLSKNVLFYMVFSEIAAVSIALCLFNVFTPGESVSPDLILNGETYADNSLGTINISNFLLSVFPNNVVAEFASFNLLPVVLFSIMFGIGAAIMKEKAEPVMKFVSGIKDIVTVCLNGVMLCAPIGIFALVGKGVSQVAQNGNLTNNFLALMSFVIILIVGLLLHALWQFILMLVLTKQNPFTVLRKSIPVFSTAFATSSSIATLPVAMQTADELQSKPEVTRFVLPLCASINIGGMMLYEVAAVLFFAQVLGVHLSLSYQLILAAICILMGMAEGGIPETSMVSFVMIFKMIKIPLSALSILLPLDRIMDRVRTMVNIFGNMCAAIIVSHFISEAKSEQISLENVTIPIPTQEG